MAAPSISTTTLDVQGAAQKTGLVSLFKQIYNAESAIALNSAGLVITGAGSTTAKIGAADFYAVANGTLVKIAASTNMPALTGLNIAQNQYNVVCFFVDSAGVVTALLGTAGATLAAVAFPAFPQGKALVGFLLIIYAAGAFTGGTTPLDTATTVYISPTTSFDASAIPGG